MGVAFQALAVKCPPTLGSDQPRADFQADGVCQIPVTNCSGRCLETVGDTRAVATIFFQALCWFWKGYYIKLSQRLRSTELCFVTIFIV